MDSLKNLIENLKEKLKAAWAEQQESPLFIQLKERYEELPPVAQKGVIWGVLALIAIVILWWPVSNLMDASDYNAQFEERRELLKDLLRIERDAASQPQVPTSPPPSMFKAQFDQKIATAGIKPDQVRESAVELPTQNVSGAEKRGVLYRIERLTVRQAVDLAYEMEHTDPNLKLDGFELIASQQDPHFYEAVMKLVNFAPKVETPPAAPGKGIVDEINKEKGKKGIESPPPPAGAPVGEAPSIPKFPRGGGK